MKSDKQFKVMSLNVLKVVFMLSLLVGFSLAMEPKEDVQAKGFQRIYQVKPGDTLSSIGVRYGVSVKLLKSVNGLTDSTIIAGHNLIIPSGSKSIQDYQVQPGDNLYNIAQKHGLSLILLKKINQITTNIIHPGQILYIPREEGNRNPPIFKTVAAINKVKNEGYSVEDVLLLARLIYAEARGESLEGKIAVGAVVLNRLAHPDFPKRIQDIIYQKNQKVYQFSPVQDGSINLEPDEESTKAAIEAIKGADPTGGALYFYNPETATDGWIKTLPTTKPIGKHIFAKE